MLREGNKDASYGYLRTRDVPLMSDSRLSSEPNSRHPVVKAVGELVLAGVAIHVGAGVIRSGMRSIMASAATQSTSTAGRLIPKGFRSYAKELLEFDDVLKRASGEIEIPGLDGMKTIWRPDDFLDPRSLDQKEYLKKVLTSRTIAWGRRIPYELPAAYITNKALFEREELKRDIEQGKMNPYNPIDWIGDYTKKSAGYAVGDLMFHLAAPAVKVANSYLEQTSPAYRNSKVMAQLVGSESADMLARMTDEMRLTKESWTRASEEVARRGIGGEISKELNVRGFVSNVDAFASGKGRERVKSTWSLFREKRRETLHLYRKYGMDQRDNTLSMLQEELITVGRLQGHVEHEGTLGLYRGRVVDRLVDQGVDRKTADLVVGLEFESEGRVNKGAVHRAISELARDPEAQSVNRLKSDRKKLFVFDLDDVGAEKWTRDYDVTIKSQKLDNSAQLSFKMFSEALTSALPGSKTEAAEMVGFAKRMASQSRKAIKELPDQYGMQKLLLESGRRRDSGAYRSMVARRWFETIGHSKTIGNLSDDQITALMEETIGGRRSSALFKAENMLVSKGQATKDPLKMFNIFGLRNATIGDVLAMESAPPTSEWGRRGRLFNPKKMKDIKTGLGTLIDEAGFSRTMGMKAESGLYVSATGKVVDLRYIKDSFLNAAREFEQGVKIPFLNVNPASMFGLSTYLDSRGPKTRLMTSGGGWFMQNEVKGLDPHSPLFQVGKNTYGFKAASSLNDTASATPFNVGRWTFMKKNVTNMGTRYMRAAAGLPENPELEWNRAERRTILGGFKVDKIFDVHQDTSDSVIHKALKRVNRSQDIRVDLLKNKHFKNVYENKNWVKKTVDGILGGPMKESSSNKYVVNKWFDFQKKLTAYTGESGKLDWNRVERGIKSELSDTYSGRELNAKTNEQLRDFRKTYTHVRRVLGERYSDESVAMTSKAMSEISGMPALSAADDHAALSSVLEDMRQRLYDPKLSDTQRKTLSNLVGSVERNLGDAEGWGVNEVIPRSQAFNESRGVVTKGRAIQHRMVQFYSQHAAMVSGDGGEELLARLDAEAQVMFGHGALSEDSYNEVKALIASTKLRVSETTSTDLGSMLNDTSRALARSFGPDRVNFRNRWFQTQGGKGLGGLSSLWRYTASNPGFKGNADAFVESPNHALNPFATSRWIGLKMAGDESGLKGGLDDFLNIVMDRPATVYDNTGKSLIKTAAGIMFKPRENGAKFTSASIGGWHYVNRVSDAFQAIGLGVTSWKYDSPAKLFTHGLLGRRMLPAYLTASIGVPLVLGMPGIGTNGLLGGAAWAAGPGLGQARAHAFTAADHFNRGMSKIPFLGGIAALSPFGTENAKVWSEALNSNEGSFLDRWSRSPEEEKEYWDKGSDPVRAGRWWLLGNNPWRGSKVSYYRPNWYRMMKSRYQFTKDYKGSEVEWALFGTDLSPLKYIDPYHYERKWGDKRPYPVTGEMFTGPWGPLRPLLNITAGNILKPRLQMHRGEGIPTDQYLIQQEMGYSHGAQQAGAMIAASSGGKMSTFTPKSFADGARVILGMVNKANSGDSYSGIANDSTQYLAAMNVTGGSGSARSARDVMTTLNETEKNRRLGKPTYRTGGSQPGYSTGEGTIPASGFVGQVPLRMYQYSRRVQYAEQALNPASPLGAMQMQFGDLGYTLQEFGGFYGFMFSTFRSGLGYGGKDFSPNRPVLQGAERAYSAERGFWDKNLGGMGDITFNEANIQLSEMTRRFNPHRRHDIEDVNRIPNQMPDWMPGANYFLDFRTGDPYTKVAEGEARMPGEGYKRLNELHPDDMGEYGFFDRFKILADIAPWSVEYRMYSQMLTKSDLSPQMRKEAADIKRQVSERKKKRTFHERAWNGKLESKTVKGLAQVYAPVPGAEADDQGMLDPNLFTAAGVDNPIRMAGVRFAKSPEGIQAARMIYDRYLKSSDVKVTYDREHKIIKDNREQTMDVIINSDGKNVNNIVRDMIRRGMPGVSESQGTSFIDNMVKTPDSVKVVATAMESLSHLNVPFVNMKFGRQTASEFYERRLVYGKSWQPWETPYKSYIEPQIDTLTAPNKGIFGPLVAGVGGGILAGAFVRNTAPALKNKLFIGGAIIGAGLSVARATDSMLHGQRWTPKRRRKEWAMDEYFDILNYIKWSNLYEESRRAAIEVDGIDPEAIVAQIGEAATARKKTWQKMWDESPVGGKPDKPESQNIYENIGPSTAQAMEYRKRMKSTMYGADLFGDHMTLAASLPKRYRDMFDELLGVAESDQKPLLDMMPRLMRRIFQAKWSRPVEEKPNLAAYFKKHELPGEDWEGWLPQVDLDEVKVKSIVHEGLDTAEFGYYPNQVDNAMEAPWAYPEITKKMHMGREQIMEFLANMGVRDVSVEFDHVPGSASGFDVQLEHDRRDDIRGMIQGAV